MYFKSIHEENFTIPDYVCPDRCNKVQTIINYHNSQVLKYFA